MSVITGGAVRVLAPWATGAFEWGKRKFGSTAGAGHAEDMSEISEEDPDLKLSRKLKEQKVETDIYGEHVRQLDVQLRMDELQRAHMTRLEKRKSIEGDIGQIQEKLQLLDGANPALRDSLRPQRDALRLQYQALANQLHEKPMDTYQGDALAKMGLFSLAATQAIATGSGTGVQNEQLRELKGIRLAVEKTMKDPLGP